MILYRYLFAAYLAISILLIVIYGYIAATNSDGTRKGRARLIASLSFASWLIVGPLASRVYESHLPVYEFIGIISSVRVDRQSSKNYSAWLSIKTSTGGNISVHVSGSSKAWSAGQNLRIRYYGDTGEMTHTELLDSEGRQTGIVNSTSDFSRDWLILLGSFLCWAAFKRYRRDPEGAEGSADNSSALPSEKTFDFSAEEPTQLELREIRENGSKMLSRSKKRAVTSGGAFLVSCALVYLVSAGQPLHRYWDSVGEIVLLLAFVLLMVFTFTVISAFNAWSYVRAIEKPE